MNGQTAELLARLFPFHVRVGTDGRVVALGTSMSKVMPDAVGCGFLDRFDVQRPRLASMAEVRGHLDELVLLAIRGTPLQMRGQFTTLPDGGIAFVGSPRIVDQSSVWSWPVGIRDFAPHDGGADYAMVIEAANMQLADLERLVRTLQEKERAERDLRLRAEDASAAKTNFLANISHEIRTPMTAILGYAELLRDVGADPAERAEWIETIRRNGDHLLAIINDLLDLSKIEAGRFEVELAPVSVPDVVRDVVKLMRVRAASQGITLDHVVEDDLARTPVRTDAVRIRQVLLNLVGNAVKFTERGGVEVRVDARAKGPRLELAVAVRDTGCGIAPELLPRLFEPFTQSDASFARRHGGTGLGLAISRRLASLLGGRIDVASEVDRGSVFTFTFDADRADADSTPASLPMPSRPASKTGPLLGMRILLVEDSIDSQRILAALMSLAGADVDVAPDGISAVSRFDGSYVPDLVLMDIQMPGMDGIEATERIRARGYTGRIVALTAAALSIDRDRAYRAGCEGFHLKPISREDLIAMCLGDLPAAR
jgi:signal transduction histidine kinase/CheY-like chemotaxis protein